MKLNLANLASIGNSVLKTPSYQRADLTPGIVHVGVGNFFRGHQAVYMDELFQKGENLDWGIVGAGVSNGAKNVRAAMEDQDWLTTVVARDGKGQQARIIGSMVDFVPVDLETHEPLKQALLDPQIKLAMTTVTEGGYYQDENGSFDVKDPKIVADSETPDNPKTIFGIFVQALKKRRESGEDPFSILCCDNVPHGGDVVKQGVLGMAKLMKEDDLADYIEANVGFPNAMVDRIVPKTTDKERFALKEAYGYKDEWPIFCEPFTQWVLEDDFKQGRPQWEISKSVLFVDDVGPYELKKLRILNGGHASLCYPAALLGLQYVHDAMEHPVIGPFLDALERTEIIPAVPPVPNVVLEEYWQTIQNRFENPTINDRIDRNCAQGSDRQPKFIIPTALDAAKDRKKIEGLALVSAMWCRYCMGESEVGTEIPPNDTRYEELKATALAAKTDPNRWLAMHDIYGELGENPAFQRAFARALKMVNEEGVIHSMREYTKLTPITKKLNLANLAEIGKTVFHTPFYDREDLTPGIVHVGVGNFFRGHQAVYMDKLFTKGVDYDWAIIGAGVSNGAKNVRAAMEAQNWLTTVVERDGKRQKVRVTGSMVDFVPVDLETHAPLKKALLDPRIKLAMTTVTEGGYYQDENGKFDVNDPKIIADSQDPENPKTIFGIFVQALKKRREEGSNPFSILCCDNVIHGGEVVKQGVLGMAKLMKEDDLAKYIEANVGFPNAMVDRIVPKTTDKERFFLKEEYGYEDSWPIFCEPFTQWIIEDGDFKQGRPAWDLSSSVQFVDDVGPYELKKLRILNGGHASLCYPAALLGLQYVHDAMEHPVIGPFLDTLERTEIIPAVPPVPNVDLGEYWEIIQNRFENPTIADRIDRNCAQGSDRQPKFIIPTAADAIKDGKRIEGLALVSAMWCRYCQGVDESGMELPPNDTLHDELKATALAAKDDPNKWLAMHSIYGDLGENPVFQKAFAFALNTINEEGVEHAMKEYTKKYCGLEEEYCDTDVIESKLEEMEVEI